MDATLKLDKAGEQQSPKNIHQDYICCSLQRHGKDLVITECVAY